ncbi:Sigma factor PP2C-like phosphatase [Fragilaria crotonensis]|nr:Sigma factor PP2C-like phosphatase [Fragilaria crotonensis]
MMIAQSLSVTSSSRLVAILAKRSYATLDDSVRATRSYSILSLPSFAALQDSIPNQSVALPSNGVLRCASSTLHETDTSLWWSSWELLVSSVVAAFVSGAAICYTTSSMGGPTPSSEFGFASWGGGGGGSSLPPFQGKTLLLGSKRAQEHDDEEEPTVATNSEGGTSFDVSVRAIQGGRLYMEDDYFIGNGGKFVGVFDGHGGSDVSRHLRHHLYQRFQREWKRTSWEMEHSSLHSLVMALRAAFLSIDAEVLGKDAMQYQGSTAVAVAIHEGEDGSKTLVSANVGDSRAVLCRRGMAVDMTRDHKPGDERERARIENMGEQIEWDNYGKIHRVKNLSLSRAIGDRFAKPTVSGEAEIQLFPLREDDEFIVLASDGVWDVMTSEQVVQFVHRKMEAVKPSGSLEPGSEGYKIARRMQDVRRKNMSRYIASEALNRGSGDNICVVIVWLKPLNQ